MGPTASSNPILDEIQQAHSTLSPAAQKAIKLSGVVDRVAAMPAPPAVDAPEPIPSPMGMAAPRVGDNPLTTSAVSTPALAPMSTAFSAPKRGLPPLASLSAPPTPNTQEFARITKPAMPASDPNAHTSQDSGLPGIGQIKSPFARFPLQALDAIGSTFLPGLARNIPGTTAHHNALVGQVSGLASEEQKLADAPYSRAVKESESSKNQAEALRNQTSAETEESALPSQIGLRVAQKGEAEARAGGQEHENKLHDSQAREAEERANALAKPAEKPQNIHVLPDGTVIGIHTDQKTGDATANVLYKGDPKVDTDLADLEISGKPHKVIVNKRTGEVIKDLGESGIKPPVTNINAETSALDRESARYAKPHETNRQAASAQLEKIIDAESMISGNAEAQALGVPKVLTALVSGQGSGVRITQPELQAIAKARGISGDVEGTIRKWMGQGSLTKTQQQQLVSVLEDARKRIEQKQSIASSAIDKINGAKTRDEMIAADKEAREAMDSLERGASAGEDQKIKAYADQYFGGDVAKAKSAIAEQRKGKK